MPPGLDVYQGSGILAYNLGLGTITSYISLTPGAYGILVDTAGTRQQLVSAQETFATGRQYTVLIGNFANSLQELILKDQTQAAPTGQIDLRFIDQSTRAGPLDLYLIPIGSTILTVRPVLSNVIFQRQHGLLQRQHGLLQRPLRNLHAHSAPRWHRTHSHHRYQLQRRDDLLLLQRSPYHRPDRSAAHHYPRHQAIIANDFDPPGATS